MSTENDNEAEWNIVDNQPNDTQSNLTQGLQHFSQSIIIGTLNNRLSDISEKMDLIISKLDSLDKRIKTIEDQTLDKSEYDASIFNNIDIDNILNFDAEDETLVDKQTNLDNSRSKPIPTSLSSSHSFYTSSNIQYPNMYNMYRFPQQNNSSAGLKFFSGINKTKGSISNLIPPFSSPY